MNLTPNLILRRKNFVLELLNTRYCYKPEQSAGEKSSFFISSTYFGRPSGVTGTSDKFFVELRQDFKFP